MEKASIAEQRSKHKENCLEGCSLCKEGHKCDADNYVPLPARGTRIKELLLMIKERCNEAIIAHNKMVDEKLKK